MTSDIVTFTPPRHAATALRPPFDLMATWQKWKDIPPVVVPLTGYLDEDALDRAEDVLMGQLKKGTRYGTDVIVVIRDCEGGESEAEDFLRALRKRTLAAEGSFISVGMGEVSSMGSLALAMGGHRIAAPDAVVMVHGPVVTLYRARMDLMGNAAEAALRQTKGGFDIYRDPLLWPEASLLNRAAVVSALGLCWLTLTRRERAKACNVLEAGSKTVARWYQEACGGKASAWEKMTEDGRNEHYLNAQEAQQLGMVDRIGIPYFVADFLQKQGIGLAEADR